MLKPQAYNNQMTQVIGSYYHTPHQEFNNTPANFQQELQRIYQRLYNFDIKIARQLRTYPRQETACSVLAHKTYTYLPEIITNPTLRIAEFKPLMGPLEGQLTQIYHSLTDEMKLQLLESSQIPQYSDIHLKDGKMILRVKLIEMDLVLFRTSHGFQWFLKSITYHSTRDRMFSQSCVFILSQYFDYLISQLNNLDERYYDYEKLKELFIGFISYCCFQASKYLSLARFLKTVRMKDPIMFSHEYKRSQTESIEYNLQFVMPTVEDFQKTGRQSTNIIQITGKNEMETIIISFELQDSMVCQTTISVQMFICESRKTFVNNQYSGDKVYKKLTNQFLIDLIKSVEEMRLLYVTFQLKSQTFDKNGVQANLVMKISNGFIYKQGIISPKTLFYINSHQEEKLYLLTFTWNEKQVFYQINPTTLQLKNNQQIGLRSNSEFEVSPLKLGDYNVLVCLEIKHRIIREVFLPDLKIQGFRISETLSQLTPNPLLTFTITPITKNPRNFVIKIKNNCQSFKDVQISANVGPGDKALDEFMSFSHLHATDQFNLDILMERVTVFIIYFDQLKKVKTINQRGDLRGIPKVYLTRQQ